MLDRVKLLDRHKETLAAAAVVFTAVMSGPLVDEIRDVFGTPVLYHPLTVWIVLFCIVFVQTKSFLKSILVVFGYGEGFNLKRQKSLASERYFIMSIPNPKCRKTILISSTK